MRNGIRQIVLALLFTVLLYASADIDSVRQNSYSATIMPSAGSKGAVTVVFYGENFEASHAVMPKGWSRTTVKDCCINITANATVEPLSIQTYENPVSIGLVKSRNAGIAVITLADGSKRTYNLFSENEEVLTLTLGGPQSFAPSSGPKPYSTAIHLLVFIAILIGLGSLAILHTHGVANHHLRWNKPTRWEWLGFACLPFIATVFSLLTHYPTHAAHDSSYQWMQALERGELNRSIGIFTTLFMRIFASISAVPTPLILFQMTGAAIGVALVLHEMRLRGISRRVALIASALLAISPQYAVLFTYLSKDALCTMGILFFLWALLWVCRTAAEGNVPAKAWLMVAMAGMFAGAIRFNILPAIAVMVICLVVYLLWRRQRRTAFFLLVSYAMMAVLIPKALYHTSFEANAARAERQLAEPVANEKPYYGDFINFYVFHLFAAAVNSGEKLAPEDSALFYTIAAPDAWKNYDCFMLDSTSTAISSHLLLNAKRYGAFLLEHQIDMANAVGRILTKHPKILLDRQLCITRPIWYIGYGQKPFQTTVTLGYDTVSQEFIQRVGENRSLISEKLRHFIASTIRLSEDPRYFWIFWKPALPLLLGLYILSLTLTRRRDMGLVLGAGLSMAICGVMAVFIPFPAYRYIYPAVLPMLLLMTSFFTASNLPDERPRRRV